MKRRNDASAESQDGRLIGPGPDAPRECLGQPRTVGVTRWEATDVYKLSALASSLRSAGFQRSEDGVLEAGQFDLVSCRGALFALFIPRDESAAAGSAAQTPSQAAQHLATGPAATPPGARSASGEAVPPGRARPFFAIEPISSTVLA